MPDWHKIHITKILLFSTLIKSKLLLYNEWVPRLPKIPLQSSLKTTSFLCLQRDQIITHHTTFQREPNLQVDSNRKNVNTCLMHDKTILARSTSSGRFKSQTKSGCFKCRTSVMTKTWRSFSVGSTWSKARGEGKENKK